jgi:uncharacterized protein (DUF2236 family)
MENVPELDGIGALLAGTANVVMQLSRPAVGYGVVESMVESGQLMRHPLKRFRTTFTYLAVAMKGSDRERQLYRAALNRVHTGVRSGPDSPVEYDAFDPELQKWVAACLYQGAVDIRTRMHGAMSVDEADCFYRDAARLATTLQVRPEDWPPDRPAFDRYWDEALSLVAIDDTVRSYLHRLIRLEYLPLPCRSIPAGVSQFLTVGFLAPRFRDALGLPWNSADQRRFDQLIGAIGAVNRRLPSVVRELPFNACLWDMRLRQVTGRPLI